MGYAATARVTVMKPSARKIKIHNVAELILWTDLKPTHRTILSVLARYAHFTEGRGARPSLKKIITESCMGRRQVLRALKELQQDGRIQPDKRHRKATCYDIRVVRVGDETLWAKVTPVLGDKSDTQDAALGDKSDTQDESKPQSLGDKSDTQDGVCVSDHARKPDFECQIGHSDPYVRTDPLYVHDPLEEPALRAVEITPPENADEKKDAPPIAKPLTDWIAEIRRNAARPQKAQRPRHAHAR